VLSWKISFGSFSPYLVLGLSFWFFSTFWLKKGGKEGTRRERWDEMNGGIRKFLVVI